ncbi:MAG: 50S ribosomal protein L11 methyltransferase [Gemmatimonadaceae bacterium]
MTLPWRSIRIDDCTDREGVIAALFDEGSQGIQEDADAILTHFPRDTDTDAIVAALKRVDPGAVIVVGDAPPVNWDEWRADVGAHRVGALIVAPPWLADQLDPAATIVIDPAMAFGTGEHPTTRGVIRLMQNVIHAGDTVADLGAGSAVLSIAAARLGAARVAAIELDADAVETAEANIARNGVKDVVRFLQGDAIVLLALVAPVRVVLANIVSSVLAELMPVTASALTPDGEAILSGMLVEERDMMLALFSRGGWRVTAEDIEGDWWSVALRRADFQ